MKNNLLGVVLSLFLNFQLVPAQAQVLEGEEILALSLVNQENVSQSFESIKGEKGAVLVFVRSASWCPYCQKQLMDLNNFYQDIRATGYELVSISYDSVDVLKDFHNKHEMQFDLLSDEGSEIIKAFGILNTDMKPGSRAYGIPNPAIYIVSSEGRVIKILSEEGYKKRPSPELILETINKNKRKTK